MDSWVCEWIWKLISWGAITWVKQEDMETVKIKCELLELGEKYVKEARGINSFPSGHQGVVMSQRHVESTPGSRDDWLGL